jgi:pyoverdine/dityrosine biosynthesis protein Dit1
MRSNRLVYPSLEFKNLNPLLPNKYQILEKKVVDFRYVKKLITKTPQPILQVSGFSIAEKVLNLFASNQIIFGPRRHIHNHRKEWIDKLEYFIEKNLPIKFSILGFPFKMPMPLKTNRILPDMGEVLALFRLVFIVRQIKKIYKPGAIVVVFTEGSFAKFVNLPVQQEQQYQAQLLRFVKQLGYQDKLTLIPLGNIEKLPEFKTTYKSLLRINQQNFLKKEKIISQAYSEAGLPITKIVNTRMYKIKLLKDIFNKNLKRPNQHVLLARKAINKRSENAFIQYFSYIQTKNQINFIDRTIGQNLPLTVSAKEHRLGILPVAKHVNILPFHGVTVYDPSKRKFDVMYLTDLQASSVKLIPVHLKGDKDNRPFYYELTKQS